MKKTKRVLALMLACLTVFLCAACQEAPPQEATPEPTGVAKLEALVGEGDYEAAYRVLETLDTAQAQPWEDKLVYLPVGAGYEYDERGYLTQRDDGEQVTYVCDEDGRLLVETRLNEDGSTHKTESTYDEKGNLATITDTDGEGQVVVYRYTTTVEETDAGRVESTRCTYTTDGVELTHTNVSEYDPAGRLMKRSWIDVVGRKGYDAYVYDEQGRLLCEELLDRGKIFRREYTYDEQGRLLTEQATYQDEIESTEDYTYDENGRKLTYTRSAFGETCVTTYIYDEQGRVSRREERVTDQAGDTGVMQYRYTYTETGHTITTADGQEVEAWQVFYYPHGIPEWMKGYRL